MKAFAKTFTTQHKDTAFSIRTLLDHMNTTYKNIDLENRSQSTFAHLTPEGQVSLTQGSAPSGSKQKKQCANYPTCKNHVKINYHQFCDPCFTKHKTGMSTKGAEALLAKRKANNRRRWAKRNQHPT